MTLCRLFIQTSHHLCFVQRSSTEAVFVYCCGHGNPLISSLSSPWGLTFVTSTGAQRWARRRHLRTCVGHVCSLSLLMACLGLQTWWIGKKNHSSVTCWKDKSYSNPFSQGFASTSPFCSRLFGVTQGQSSVCSWYIFNYEWNIASEAVYIWTGWHSEVLWKMTTHISYNDLPIVSNSLLVAVIVKCPLTEYDTGQQICTSTHTQGLKQQQHVVSKCPFRLITAFH